MFQANPELLAVSGQNLDERYTDTLGQSVSVEALDADPATDLFRIDTEDSFSELYLAELKERQHSCS